MKRIDYVAGNGGLSVSFGSPGGFFVLSWSSPCRGRPNRSGGPVVPSVVGFMAVMVVVVLVH